MTLSLIVAMTEDRVIGNQNKLPWHLSEDLKRFKSITMGHPIIMGRKTFDSIGKPLPGRHNIVLSRNRNKSIVGVTVVGKLEEALDQFAAVDMELFVIGGAEIYRLALPLADKLYVTLIHQKFEGDTFFPPFQWNVDFKVTERADGLMDAASKIKYSYIIGERNS